MTGNFSHGGRRRRQRGFALITVLLFVVLVLGLVLAFLLQSTTAHQTSYSSLNETKASLLASSAGSTIIGDLKQEIIDGSTPTTPAAGQNVYTPLSNFNAKPALAGFTPSYTSTSIASATMPAVVESDGLANLIKRSAWNPATGQPVPFYASNGNASYSENGPARACSVNSITPSIDGSFISAATWNSHYLLAQLNPGSTTDSTPVNAFTPPDWIMVARDGSNPTTFTSAMKNALETNNQFVVGRYAYAIYDEGGLLNLNAAGYPAANTLTPSQIATNKNSPALADLAQLPASISTLVTGTTSSSGSLLTAQQIDNLVGWRNYASAGLNSSTGAFGSVSFSTGTATSWLDNFVSNPATGFYNTNGFMNVVAPAGAVQAATDQQFLSRGQLIELTQALKIPPSALQYLGTFSRALEQPSYSPDPKRPMIIGTIAPPLAGAADNYQGNNDAYGGDETVNPPFLSIRVPGTPGGESPFTRWNGAKAVIGEPLVKTKFALSWLPMVAYNATNTALNAPFAPTASDPDPIYDRFGLKRTNTSAPWTYDHGIRNSLGQTIIGTLAQVAAAGREPDFAELLKASITAGSLAKGGPNLHDNQNNYQYTLDTSLDFNILQIMANLIDQADTDSYPTQIQMVDSTGQLHVFSGIEDLPYFYRYHILLLTTDNPIPYVAQNSSPEITPTPQSVSDQGSASYLYIPSIWNPHDPSTLQTSSTNRPTKYKLTASTQDPLGATSEWNIVLDLPPITFATQTTTNPNGTTTTTVTSAANNGWPDTQSTPTALTPTTSWMTFTDDKGTLFREPTLLWHPGIPANSGLAAAPTGNIQDVNTGRNWVGIFAGSIALEQSGYTQQLVSSQSPASTTSPCIFVDQAAINSNSNSPPGAYQQITFNLQYQDPNGNWITYDSKYPDLHGLQGPVPVPNAQDEPNNLYQNVLKNNEFPSQAACMDPRTARFGVGTADAIGLSGPLSNGNASAPGVFTYEPHVSNDYQQLVNTSANTSAASPWNLAIGTSDFTIIESDRARNDEGDEIYYSNPGMTSDPGQNVQMRWFSGVGYSATNPTGPNEWDGMFSQNDPNVAAPGRQSTPGALYYEDADGIARRAMGAYAKLPLASTSSPTTVYPSLQTVLSKTIYPGFPMAQANTYATVLNDDDVATPFAQSESRPTILNRPFRSVSEMSYAFRGTPWKNVDFSTPESGDSPLLDVFCVNESPANAMVAGKVDLNTRQEPVLQAMMSGATLDEDENFTTPPAWAQGPVTPTDAQYAASRLLGITSDTTDAWRGPLENISGLVGRFVANPGNTGSATDQYTFNETVTNKTYTYAGFSAALDTTVYASDTSNPQIAGVIERLREAALRPLADQGQTRVWNLLIDLVAQTGRYPVNATTLNQFLVEGEKHIWLHVAIDRMTGQVIDEQVENVSQ